MTTGLLALRVAVALPQSKNPPVNHKWDYTALVKVPAKAQSKPNPLENDPEAVAAGAKLFGERCSGCHGKDAAGARRGPSLLIKTTQEASPGAIYYVLTNGVIRRGMPGWGNLPPLQRWQLVSFIKSLPEEKN